MSSEHVEVLERLRDRWATPGECAALDAAIASLSAPKPEGEWVLVPRDPTAVQVRAGQLGVTTDCTKAIYAAMLATAPQPPAEAQAQGGGEVVAGELRPCPFCGAPAERIDFGPGDAENEGGSCIACTQCQSSGPVEFGRKENFVSNWNRRTAPPSAPVGVEAVDAAAAWNEALELPTGFRVAEHLPGIWEYQFDIEDEADDDSDRKVSGTSWNHPVHAAIAAWSHAYDALAQQPAAVDDAMVERATMALLGKTHDSAPGVDWRCDRSWTVNRVRELMRLALSAALASQQPPAEAQPVAVFNCPNCPVAVESQWREPDCPECGERCFLDQTAKPASPPSAPVEECPDCTNGHQCDSCSRGEQAVLESSVPVGVDGLPAKWRDAVSGMEGTWDDKSQDGYKAGFEECAEQLEAALAQQPTHVAPVGDSLLQTALRNLPQYISKSGLVGPDKHAAMQCFETLRDALSQQPAATLPDEDDSDLTVAYMAGLHDGRKEAQQPAADAGIPTLRPSAPVGVEGRAREAVALALDERGHHTEADNVRNGIDLDEYRDALSIARAALAQQPASVECPHRARCDCLCSCKYGMAGDGALASQPGGSNNDR